MDISDKPRINLKDLPSRARRLSEQDISMLFGGCTKTGGGCNSNKDCCPGHECVAKYTYHAHVKFFWGAVIPYAERHSVKKCN